MRFEEIEETHPSGAVEEAVGQETNCFFKTLNLIY